MLSGNKLPGMAEIWRHNANRRVKLHGIFFKNDCNINNRKLAQTVLFDLDGPIDFSVGQPTGTVCLDLVLTEKTGSATMLAFASFFSYLPEVILAPFAGALVDRWNRRRVMIVADGSIALATIAVALLFWLGWVQIWHVFVVLFLRSLGNLSHWAAMKASTSMMVPEEHLARIAGINQALQGGVNIAGPALGAILLGVMPIFVVLFIDVGTALLAIIPLLFVIIPQPQGAGVGKAVTVRSVLGDVRQGMRYVLSWRGLSVLLLMAVLCNFFFTPLFSILPILVTGYFKGGVYQLGWIESAWGVGVVTGRLDPGSVGRVQAQDRICADWVDRHGAGDAVGVAGSGTFVLAGTGRDGFLWCKPSHHKWAFSCHYSKQGWRQRCRGGCLPWFPAWQRRQCRFRCWWPARRRMLLDRGCYMHLAARGVC